MLMNILVFQRKQNIGNEILDQLATQNQEAILSLKNKYINGPFGSQMIKEQVQL